MNNLTYRTASLEDLQAILELLDKVKAHNKIIDLKIWQKDYPNATFIVNDLKDACGRVIEDEDGKILAYTAFVKTDEEYGVDAFSLRYLMTFSRLMVNPETQGQGIGYFFIQQLINETRMIDGSGLAITVDDFNERAVNLYKKFGFTKTGIYRIDELDVTLDKYLLRIK